jgi:hypothetical protein
MVKAVTREAEIIEGWHEMWRVRSAAGRPPHDCQTLVRRRVPFPPSECAAVSRASANAWLTTSVPAAAARELNGPGETRRARAGTHPGRIQGWIRNFPNTGVQSWQFDGNR